MKIRLDKSILMLTQLHHNSRVYVRIRLWQRLLFPQWGDKPLHTSHSPRQVQTLSTFDLSMECLSLIVSSSLPLIHLLILSGIHLFKNFYVFSIILLKSKQEHYEGYTYTLYKELHSELLVGAILELFCLSMEA